MIRRQKEVLGEPLEVSFASIQYFCAFFVFCINSAPNDIETSVPECSENKTSNYKDQAHVVGVWGLAVTVPECKSGECMIGPQTDTSISPPWLNRF